MKWPTRVLVREVGPRDGLQNEARFVPTADKIQLIKMLVEAGVRAIEATSFVHPRAVPQMADAELVIKRVKELLKKEGMVCQEDNNSDGTKVVGSMKRVSVSALVGNRRGIERALAAGIGEVVVVVSASEKHNLANVNMPVAESLVQVKEICALALAAGLAVRGAVSTAFGCPYQGEISQEQVALVVEGMLKAGIREITLADTAGMGNPRQVYVLLTKLSRQYPEVTWALHFHDTRGLALANIVTGLQAGVTIFESSVGGLGGCPFIPGAAGNVASEDLVNMLHSMRIDTGVNLQGILECVAWLEGVLGKRLK